MRLALTGTTPVVSVGLRAIFARAAHVSIVPDDASADVVLIDVSSSRGAPEVPRLGVPLVALARPGDLPYLRSVGVHAVDRAAGPQELVTTVATAHTIGRSPTASARSTGSSDLTHHDPVVPLSERERWVIDGICRGLSNQELASSMFLSINSVKTYIRGAYRKIGVERRGQAIIWGLEHGFGHHVGGRPAAAVDHGDHGEDES